MLTLLAATVPSGLGCSLCTPTRAGDGPVFELTTDSLDAAAERHDLLLLLLYRGASDEPQMANAKRAFGTTAGRLHSAFNDPYLDPSILDPELRASLASEVTDERHTVMLAQLDAAEHPLALHRLGVHEAELPALRLLRGDASYGYKIRGPPDDFVTRTGLAVFDELKAERAPAVHLSEAAEADAGSHQRQPRVIGTLPHGTDTCAFQRVAHAFRKDDPTSTWPAVPFAVQPTSGECTAAALRPAPAPPPAASAPSVGIPARHQRTPLPPPPPPRLPPSVASSPTAVLMAHAPSADGATSTLTMPLAAGARLSAQRLHAWVHWAALPKVAPLDSPASVATFLREGTAGLLLHSGEGTPDREAAARRLRALAGWLESRQAHGVTLLHAPRAVALPILPSTGPASAALRAAAAGAAPEEEGVVISEDLEERFVIIRSAGGRVAEVHVMAQPTSDVEAMRALCLRFAPVAARDTPTAASTLARAAHAVSQQLQRVAAAAIPRAAALMSSGEALLGRGAAEPTAALRSALASRPPHYWLQLTGGLVLSGLLALCPLALWCRRGRQSPRQSGRARPEGRPSTKYPAKRKAD